MTRHDTDSIRLNYVSGLDERAEYEEGIAFDEWLKAERGRIWDEGYDANDAGPRRENPYA